MDFALKRSDKNGILELLTGDVCAYFMKSGLVMHSLHSTAVRTVLQYVVLQYFVVVRYMMCTVVPYALYMCHTPVSGVLFVYYLVCILVHSDLYILICTVYLRQC